MRRPSSSPPATPYCIIAQLAFGNYIRTMRVPEAFIPRIAAHGWIVLIRDSEMPPPSIPATWQDVKSNPRRQADEGDDA